MSKQSSYHQWDYPEEGETNWDAIVNPWIENDLDEEVVRKGTRADQPAAGTAGRWFLVTDELALEYDDGSNWQAISEPDTRVETQDAGTSLYADTPTVNFDSTTDLDVSDDGAGTVTVGATGTGSGDSSMGVTVGATGDYSTIQAAHDTEGEDTAIHIENDYDHTQENWPVDLTKKFDIRSQGENSIVLSSGTKGFVVNIGTVEYPGGRFRDLSIVSGTTAIDIQDARYIEGWRLLCENQSNHAMIVGEQGATDSVSCRFYNSTFEDAGAAGVNAGARTHGLTFINCVSEQNATRGYDLDSGQNIGFYGGSVQLNGQSDGEVGINMESCGTVNVHKVYFEDNGTGPEIQLSSAKNAVITNSYFQGFNNKSYAIARASPRTGTASIEDCYFNQYTGAAIDLVDGSDQDIYRQTHWLVDVPALIDSIATRTRTDGTIITQDTSNVTGQYDGDQAIDDGTNTQSGNPALKVWDGAGSKWETSGGTDTRVESLDAGVQLYADTPTIDFDSSTDLTVSDDGAGTVTVGAVGGTGGTHDSGTLGTMNGGDTTQSFTIGEFSTTETAAISTVAVYVEGSAGWNADYAFNYDWSHRWSDESGDGTRAINIIVTVNWDIDPGSGNDLTLQYEVRS